MANMGYLRSHELLVNTAFCRLLARQFRFELPMVEKVLTKQVFGDIT